MTAELSILHVGYANDRVAGTVTLIRDEGRIIVVDPGMVADRSLILQPLLAAGVPADDVTDVVISHHHPDHTVNIALFPNAVVHDFMASYEHDVWTDHDPGDRALTSSVQLLGTPGHTAEDLSTAVTTADGLVVLTHLWWSSAGPADDPFAPDATVLAASRARVLSLSPVLIVPGHGDSFVPGPDTPQ
ncbi:hypothetical protein BH10ACT8_BH10ACT8_10780 [soil metagenome]|jgi:glyoxylase-like metal-dependent hydrolase (beta-lactamase superfamily II)